MTTRTKTPKLKHLNPMSDPPTAPRLPPSNMVHHINRTAPRHTVLHNNNHTVLRNNHHMEPRSNAHRVTVLPVLPPMGNPSRMGSSRVAIHRRARVDIRRRAREGSIRVRSHRRVRIHRIPSTIHRHNHRHEGKPGGFRRIVLISRLSVVDLSCRRGVDGGSLTSQSGIRSSGRKRLNGFLKKVRDLCDRR